MKLLYVLKQKFDRGLPDKNKIVKNQHKTKYFPKKLKKYKNSLFGPTFKRVFETLGIYIIEYIGEL